MLEFCGAEFPWVEFKAWEVVPPPVEIEPRWVLLDDPVTLDPSVLPLLAWSLDTPLSGLAIEFRA